MPYIFFACSCRQLLHYWLYDEHYYEHESENNEKYFEPGFPINLELTSFHSCFLRNSILNTYCFFLQQISPGLRSLNEAYMISQSVPTGFRSFSGSHVFSVTFAIPFWLFVIWF